MISYHAKVTRPLFDERLKKTSVTFLNKWSVFSKFITLYFKEILICDVCMYVYFPLLVFQAVSP